MTDECTYLKNTVSALLISKLACLLVDWTLAQEASGCFLNCESVRLQRAGVQ